MSWFPLEGNILYLEMVRNKHHEDSTDVIKEGDNDRSHVALTAQLGEHCIGIAEVVGSNPAQSLNFFRLLF